MKKINFSDKYNLTEAVLSGRKTQTRRIVSERLWDRWTDYDDFCNSVAVGDIPTTRQYYKEEDFFLDNSPYRVGEVVAVAQSYASIVDELENPKNFYCMEHWESAAPKRAHYCSFLYHPGMTNKMFVSAYEMPHHIRITNVRVERLNEISDDDCLREGITRWVCRNKRYYGFFDYIKDIFLRHKTPREAYAALIDKISGRGTFDSNPYVFVYDFEIVK